MSNIRISLRTNHSRTLSQTHTHNRWSIFQNVTEKREIHVCTFVSWTSARPAYLSLIMHEFDQKFWRL
jgi:hypothetical protein